MRSRKLRHIIFSLTSLSILFSSASQAQEQSETKPEPKNLPQNSNQTVEIKAQGKKYDPRRDDTVSKFVVTKEEIEKYGDTKLSDILNRQPGIINGSLHGLRGYTQYLIDGQQPPSNFRLDDIQPEQIERIEVVRSAVAEFSTQAIGGTINIVFKRQISKANKKLQFTIRHQSESPVSKRVALNLSETSENISYEIYGAIGKTYYGRTSLGSLRQQQNGYAEIETEEVQTHSLNNNLVYAVSPGLRWKPSDLDTFSIKARAVRLYGKTEDSGIRSWLNAAPQKLQTESGNDTWRPQTSFIELSWSRLLSEHIKLNNTLSGYRAYITSSNQASISSLGLITRQDLQVLENYKKLVWSGDISVDESDKNSLKSGWYFDSWESGTIANDFTATESQSKVRLQNLAIYSQKEWEASDVWSHYLGVRWEGFVNRVNLNNGASVEKTISMFSPIAQTRWKDPVNKQNQIRIALARTFKNPEPSQLITSTLPHLNNDLSLPDIIGNPHLRPEIAWGLDSAFEHFGDNELNYSVSHYLKKVDYLLRDELFQKQGRWLQQTINDGSAVSHGFIFETNFPITLISKDLPRVDLKMNASRNWSTVSNIPRPNNRFAQQAKFNANVSVDYKYNDAWKLGSSYNVVSGGPLRLAPDRTTLVQVTRKLDAYVNWAMNKETNLRCTVSNLLMQPIHNETTVGNDRTFTKLHTQQNGVLFASINLEVKF